MELVMDPPTHFNHYSTADFPAQRQNEFRL